MVVSSLVLAWRPQGQRSFKPPHRSTPRQHPADQQVAPLKMPAAHQPAATEIVLGHQRLQHVTTILAAQERISSQYSWFMLIFYHGWFLRSFLLTLTAVRAFWGGMFWGNWPSAWVQRPPSNLLARDGKGTKNSVPPEQNIASNPSNGFIYLAMHNSSHRSHMYVFKCFPSFLLFLQVDVLRRSFAALGAEILGLELALRTVEYSWLDHVDVASARDSEDSEMVTN